MNNHSTTVSPSQGRSPLQRWWHNLDFLQQRMVRMCLSMAVMVLCFPLYYLGFFGSVDGPLHPARIGDSLAGLGATRHHVAIILVFCLMVAVSWNWVYNWVSLRMGARLTCKRTIDADGNPCGGRVRREKILTRKKNPEAVRYVCVHGHRGRTAHFHPIRKGTVSHSLWVILLCFVIIVLFV